jgi:hypothetical protein
MTLKELITQHAAPSDTYEQIAAKLNAPTIVVNPHAGEIETTTVATPITMDSITAIVPPEEAAVIYVKAPGLIANMQQAIDADNRGWLAYLLQTAASPTIGALSSGTVTALTELLQATTTTTETQPATLTGPSLAQAAGFDYVTSTMVQGALN